MLPSDIPSRLTFQKLSESNIDRLSEGMSELYLKMRGRKLYEYALTTVPGVVKESLDKAGLNLGDVSKVLLHQANAKMDEAILKRLFKVYGIQEIPDGIMPMTISTLGNSSVATVPTLLDLILREKLDGHRLAGGDVLFVDFCIVRHLIYL